MMPAQLSPSVDPWFFSAPRVSTYAGTRALTHASGFHFERDQRLYRQRRAVWRQGRDAGGDVDVAVLEIERRQLPASVIIQAFTPVHLVADFAEVRVDESLLVVGFSPGFHDTRHHLPVLRHAVMASPYGIRCVAKLPQRCRGRCWACTPRAWTWATVTWRKTSRWD